MENLNPPGERRSTKSDTTASHTGPNPSVAVFHSIGTVSGQHSLDQHFQIARGHDAHDRFCFEPAAVVAPYARNSRFPCGFVLTSS